MATKRIELIGLIWQRGTDNVVFSAHIDGSWDISYLEIPKLAAHLQEVAKQRGIGVGDICDEVNAELRRLERERLIASGMPFGEFEFELTAEQAGELAKVFGMDDQRPASG